METPTPIPAARWVRLARRLLAEGGAYTVALAWMLGPQNTRHYAEELLKTEDLVGKVDAVACHKAAMVLLSVIEMMF